MTEAPSAQTWYPLAPSEELGTELRAFDTLGGRIVAYRQTSGTPVALSAWCTHLGADLAHGYVEDDEVMCAFHRYRFGPDGTCTVLAVNHLPPEMPLHPFPCQDRSGVVWIHNARHVTHELPVPDLSDPRVTTALVDDWADAALSTNEPIRRESDGSLVAGRPCTEGIYVVRVEGIQVSPGPPPVPAAPAESTSVRFPKPRRD